MPPSSPSVRHLGTLTMRPVFGTRLVGHSLLVERPEGLLLVGAGLGRADLAEPRRLGRAWRATMRPALDPAGTAVAQVEGLGWTADDVNDVVLTHLDLDHAGGVADFPRARVHVTAAELAAAREPRGGEHGRYLPVQWSGSDVVAHAPTADGPDWFGLGQVSWVADDVALVPLPGHSRGHAGVAVRTTRPDGSAHWWLHAGDAYFDADQLTGGGRRRLLALQRMVALDHEQRVATTARLAALATAHADELTVFCDHDPGELTAAMR